MKQKLIVLEGTDGCGKTTQFELVINRLASIGIQLPPIYFPYYDSPSCYFVKEYLAGKYGMEVDAKVASTFYLLDQFDTMEKNKDTDLVLARYYTSNLVFQASKLETEEEMVEFIQWHNTMAEIYRLPTPDKVILLDMPPEKGQELRNIRGGSSTGDQVDIHEDNKNIQNRAYRTSHFMVQYFGWEVISCVNPDGTIRSIEDMHEEIFDSCRKTLEI